MKRSVPRMGAAPARLAIFLVFAALGLQAPARAASWEDPKSSWRNGPVRELLTPDEDKAFKALKTDEERAKAIAEFWARRDPSPGTPENEFHADFAKRVTDADAQFGEGTGPGWMTDRGRLLLIAGYPGNRKTGTVDGIEQETWTYPQFADAPEFADYKAVLGRITFQKQDSGEMRASPEASQVSSVIRKLDPAAVAKLTTPKGAIAEKPKTHAAPAVPAAAAPGGAPAAPATPPAAEMPAGVSRLKQATLEAEPKTELEVKPVARYFMAEGGATRAVVVVAVKKGEIAVGDGGKPRTLLYASFLPDGETTPIEFYEQELFTLYDDATEGWLKYAFAWTLIKKSYQLKVAASDGADGKIGTAFQSLTLPDYKSDALLMSSVTLAHASQASGPADKPESEDAFRLGSLRLVPWVKPVLGPKDDLAFFYDVYHARRDPGTNKPQLDVTYAIAKKEPSGWKPRGKLDEPGKQEERLGYTIPADSLTAWPAGDYRLTVQVKDKIANTTASSSVEFSLAK